MERDELVAYCLGKPGAEETFVGNARIKLVRGGQTVLSPWVAW